MDELKESSYGADPRRIRTARGYKKIMQSFSLHHGRRSTYMAAEGPAGGEDDVEAKSPQEEEQEGEMILEQSQTGKKSLDSISSGDSESVTKLAHFDDSDLEMTA